MSQQAQETALRAFVDLISELVVNGRLNGAHEGFVDAHRVAQARTTEILLALDKDRKRRVLKLIYDLHLIHRYSPVLSLRNAALEAADLSGVTLDSAYLAGADLRTADLRGAYLVAADLRNADLQDAKLQGVDLRKADLRGAILKGANLSEADLTGADLSGAHVEGADLREAIVTTEQIKQARGDQTTILPDYLQAPHDVWSKRAATQGGDNGSGPPPPGGRSYPDGTRFRPPPSGSTNEEDNALPTFLDIGQLLATYLGIPALLLYPVGFLVFVIQIGYFYPFNLATAWYAASMIPATVVTGQGAKYLLVPLLISSIISSFVARALILRHGEALRAAFKEEEHTDPGWGALVRTRLSMLRRQLTVLFSDRGMLVVSISLIVALIVLVVETVVYAVINDREGLLYWAFFLPLSAISGSIGGRAIIESYYKEPHAADQPAQGSARFFDWLWRGVRERWIFKGLLIAYAGSVISAFLVVFPLNWLKQDPDLPHVKMEVAGRVIEDGLLLSHSDGYWHVIDTLRRGNSASIGGQSFIVSAGKDVSDVRIYESPLEEADLDPEVILPQSRWVTEDLTYTVKVKNNGPDTATQMRLVNDLPLPKKVEFVSARRAQEELHCPTKKGTSAEENVKACEAGNVRSGGTAEIEVTVQPKAEATANDPFSFAADVNASQRDPDPEDRDAKDIEVQIDDDPPRSEMIPAPEANSDGWHNSDVTLRLLTLQDNKGGSGVERVTYGITGAQSTPETEYDPAHPPVIEEEGATKVTYHAVDVAGNTELENSLVVQLDKTEPTVECEAPNEAWQNEDVSIACTASDGTDGSGIKGITYSFSGAQNIDREPTESTSISLPTITKEGETQITYSAEDVAGNVGSEQTFTVRLDKTAPKTTLDDSGPHGLTRDSEPTFTFAGSDNLTADKDLRFFYRVDEIGEWEEASGTSITLRDSRELADGDHTFFVKAVDEADNEDTTPEERSFIVDTEAPITTASATIPGGTYAPDMWTSKDVTVRFTADDDGGSGVERMFYGATGAQSIPATEYDPAHPPVIKAEGTTTIAYHAEDELGNVEDTKTFAVNIDKTAPSTTIESGPRGTINKGSVTFEFSSDEKDVAFECYLDDAQFHPCDSPRTYDVADGEHTFYVRARDASRNVGRAAERSFTIDTTESTTECDTAELSQSQQETSTAHAASDCSRARQGDTTEQTDEEP